MSELNEKLLEIAKRLDLKGDRVRVEFEEDEQGQLVLLYLKEDKVRAVQILQKAMESEELLDLMIDDELYVFTCSLLGRVHDDVIGEICTRLSLVAQTHILENVVKH